MKKNNKLFLLILLIAGTEPVLAQANRYMVFFSDKDGSGYSIDRPEEFLSERSLVRREKRSIEVTVADLPVNPSYVESIEALGIPVYFTSKWFNAVLVQTSEELVAQLSGLAFVDSVRYIAKGERLSPAQVNVDIPDTFRDPATVAADTDAQLNLIGADEMLADGFSGEGVLIAVFDAGFLGVNQFTPFEHLFDENRVLGWKDFVHNSGNVFQFHDHGSSSLSCIAARYDDVSGTAPDADFLLLVTEDVTSEYRVEEYNWLLAAEYADSAGADVISGSLGYSFFSEGTMNYSIDDLDGSTTIVSRAAGMASDRGIIVVVSAGNEGDNSSWPYITAPADARDALAVGSVTETGLRSGFSSVGPTADGRIKPDVMAMGTMTTIFRYSNNNGSITHGNGTSFAAPQIAGLAAGILQAKPHWTNLDVIDSIRLSGSNSMDPDTLYGYGIPSYNRTVSGAPLTVDEGPKERISIYPNPSNENSIYIRFEGITLEDPLVISITDPRGAEIFVQTVKPENVHEEMEIRMASSSSGMYYLKLVSGNFIKIVKLVRI